jgi:hypothetical protein
MDDKACYLGFVDEDIINPLDAGSSSQALQGFYGFYEGDGSQDGESDVEMLDFLVRSERKGQMEVPFEGSPGASFLPMEIFPRPGQTQSPIGYSEALLAHLDQKIKLRYRSAMDDAGLCPTSHDFLAGHIMRTVWV